MTLPPRASVPAIQVRGSWTRLHVAKLGGGTDGRENFSCFIWNSHVYVTGRRQTSAGPWHRDIWALDLAKLDTWRQLPAYPIPWRVSGMFLNCNILVHYDCAILFTGRPTVDVLDLKTETWGSSARRTHRLQAAADLAAGVVDDWPYPGHILSDTTMQIVGVVAAERHCAMACAYHEKLRKTIVFGGYHPSLSTYVLTPGCEMGFYYSYFADTLIYDAEPTVPAHAGNPTLSAPRWNQAHIACDSVTGKTFMFGAWTNSQFIPTRTNLSSRSFGDLWEMRMDVPGGHFEEVNVQEEARIARAGRQRCFACAGAGPWKECGGSCEDRAFFCGATCLREG
ncbi:hypothetical protein DFH09DRAFT_1086432 [Mycena vulgaris]|nr:hypothetical protein DFH09DRAFT_1086432 [Mycena vulgaris]